MTPRDLASVASHLHLPANAELIAECTLRMGEKRGGGPLVLNQAELRELLDDFDHLHARLEISVRINDVTEQQAWSLAERVKVWLGEGADAGADESGAIYRFLCDGGTLRIFGDKTECVKDCPTCANEGIRPTPPACALCTPNSNEGWESKTGDAA